ncbi:substrate-binding domain-containing protein [Prolixibacteraceae bacterium Z1-6]|uniref:Substrate-binding domain-containing protein n=1 Tax=Draconibacterium aestuarii TaxID=2998507 RepID=A0A9X3F5N4_9BACT|nr:substrate-binding domain-containing protein [Prolixibacteraceae bacterium Z1-6]
MNQKKKVTIQDVARLASVSAGTVDRIIHNRGKVSPGKKQKVEDAIKQLGFKANLLARTLALGTQHSIACLIPAVASTSRYWDIPKKGILQACKTYKDFGIEVELFHYDLFNVASFKEQCVKIVANNPAGVILAPLFVNESKSFLTELQKRNIPVVLIDADIPDTEHMAYVGPDVERSGYIAGKLMKSLLSDEGELLTLNVAKGELNAPALKRIDKGFAEFFSANKLNHKFKIQKLIIHMAKEEEVFRELTKFYIKNPTIKGVFVTNSMAHMVSNFHLQHDLDIKVIGFDLVEENIKHIKKGGIDYIISQSPMQQGFRAVQHLFEFFIYKKEPIKKQYVPLDIIVKENVDYYIDFH